MSAFMHAPTHFAAIAGSVIAAEIMTAEEAEDLTVLLVEANRASFEYRYNDDAEAEAPTRAQIAAWVERPLDPPCLVDALKSVRYQSCETPDWGGGRADKMIDMLIREATVLDDSFGQSVDLAWSISSDRPSPTAIPIKCSHISGNRKVNTVDVRQLGGAFETMAFDAEGEEIDCVRSKTEADARRVHYAMVQRLDDGKIVVGSVLVYTWGYDQTNAQFYRVTKRTPKTIVMREVDVTYEATGFMQGVTAPAETFIGEPLRKRIWRSGSGEEAISMSFGVAKRWMGAPVHVSSYA